ncbi:MAG: radical SAM protein [Myxococcales bacterium]|nr:MAG: radical SAM protein [Myxococcales bacterium]
MARLGYIQVVRTCNQHCRFCSNPENDRELSFDDARALADKFKRDGYDGVILTGGEPTLYEPLPDLIRYANATGLACRIITNGQRTADPAYLDSLLDAGLRHLHLSIHTHKPRLQALLTGNRDSLANLIRTLHRARSLPLRIDINQTICRHNADHLADTARWIVERFPRVRHFSYNFLDPRQNRVAEHPDVIPRLKDCQASLLAAMRFLDESGRTFRIDLYPPCLLGDYAFAATETRALVKGEARTVEFLDERGSLPTNLWFFAKALKCRSCSLGPICVGVRDLDSVYSSDDLEPQQRDPSPIVARILSE